MKDIYEMSDTLHAAWLNAMDALQEDDERDWLGPAVEPRWPDRWRAWVRTSESKRYIDAWGTTQAEALRELAAVLRARKDEPLGEFRRGDFP